LRPRRPRQGGGRGRQTCHRRTPRDFVNDVCTAGLSTRNLERTWLRFRRRLSPDSVNSVGWCGCRASLPGVGGLCCRRVGELCASYLHARKSTAVFLFMLAPLRKSNRWRSDFMGSDQAASQSYLSSVWSSCSGADIGRCQPNVQWSTETLRVSSGKAAVSRSWQFSGRCRHS
jgi:hypothetical protein